MHESESAYSFWKLSSKNHILNSSYTWNTSNDGQTVVRVHLQYVNEWYEINALQSVLIKIIRLSVRRGYHHHSSAKQFSEETLQYHCISDIRNLRRNKGIKTVTTYNGTRFTATTNGLSYFNALAELYSP